MLLPCLVAPEVLDAPPLCAAALPAPVEADEVVRMRDDVDEGVTVTTVVSSPLAESSLEDDEEDEELDAEELPEAVEVDVLVERALPLVEEGMAVKPEEAPLDAVPVLAMGAAPPSEGAPTRAPVPQGMALPSGWVAFGGSV